jgi:Ca2+-binding RTX toxin-like protein
MAIRIDGTAGNDVYNEHRFENEIIYTYGGNDTVNQSFNGYGEFYLGNGNDRFISEGDGWTYGNYVDAGAGDDLMAFDTQHSTYFGGTGIDTFISTSFSNLMDGGLGIDLVSYEVTNNAVTIDLLNDIAGDRGDYSLDERIFNIENARGSNYNDLIQGDNANNILEGLAGNDTLWGLNGNDVLRGGLGNDAIAAGFGNDRVVGPGGHRRHVGRSGPRHIRVRRCDRHRQLGGDPRLDRRLRSRPGQDRSVDHRR